MDLLQFLGLDQGNTPSKTQWLMAKPPLQIPPLAIPHDVKIVDLPLSNLHPLPRALAMGNRIPGLAALGLLPGEPLVLIIDLKAINPKLYHPSFTPNHP